MKLALSCLLLLLVGCSRAPAPRAIDTLFAADLAKRCASDVVAYRVACETYISAVIDVRTIAHAADGLLYPCGEPTAAKEVDAVTAYLVKHPEKLSAPAAVVIADAADAAFGTCK